MKRFFNVFALVAVAAMALVSCSKEVNVADNATGKMKTIKVTTAIVETRTTLDADHANLVWSTGDKISLFNDADNTNSELTYAAGGDIEIEVPEATTEIYAHYPYFKNNTSGPKEVSVYINKNQTQKNPGELNGSYYPMVAKGTVSSDNKALISFYPVASALALNIYNTNLEGTETVKSVKVTPAEANTLFTGSQKTDITVDNVAYTSAASSDPITVTLTNPLSLANAAPDNKQTFNGQIYVCLAKQSYAGVTFVIETNKGVYTITSSEAKAFDCVNNDFVPVNINLAKAAFKPIEMEVLSGTYVILAKQDANTYAMGNTKLGTSARLNQVSFTEGTTETSDPSIVWTFAQQGEDYYITDIDGKYLTASSSNDANVGTTPAICSVTKNADGTYNITQTVETAVRYLSRNNSSNGFAFYGSTSQNYNLYLSPITYKALPTITWGEGTTVIDADDTNEHEIEITIADYERVTVAAFEEDKSAEAEWLEVDFVPDMTGDGGVIMYKAQSNTTANARKAVIVVTAQNDNGSVSAEMTVSQRKSGNDGPSVGDELFSTDFGSEALALADYTGGSSYNEASTIEYVASDAENVKIDTGTAGNMTSANLFLRGKNGGIGLTATIKGIKTYGAKKITVTWAANNANSTLTVTESSTDGVASANSASNTATFELTGSETTISLVFTTNTAANTRVDNVKVVLAE